MAFFSELLKVFIYSMLQKYRLLFIKVVPSENESIKKTWRTYY